MSDFHDKPYVPATVSDLDHSLVVEALSRHACNVSDAAHELGVPTSDLRRLMWANPALQDQAFEVVEARLDQAEKNVAEALFSDDPRMRFAASTFSLRNIARARRRGWITSASSADVNIGAPSAGKIVISWIGEGDDEAPDDSPVGPLIEHETNSEPPDKEGS